MNYILSIPVDFRYIPLFVFGWIVAVLVRKFAAIYRSELLKSTPQSVYFNRLYPIVVGLGVVLLYWWEIQQHGVSLAGKIQGIHINSDSQELLHLRFFSHLVLFVFLLAATYIDFEEMIIPDSITIPGTIIGLLFAAMCPQSLLPATQVLGIFDTFNYPVYSNASVPLHFASSLLAPKIAGTWALVLAVALWWFWCFTMVPRIWYLRLKFRIAAAIFWRHITRSRSTVYFVVLGVFGSCVITWFWYANATLNWQCFMSALIGLAAGMVSVWAVRLIGTFSLNQEALGFGDVTLMGMIGTFLGWQICIPVFFLASILGLLPAVIRWICGYGKALPYGPFLCAATVLMVVFWPAFWNFSEPFYTLGWFVPGMMGVCFIMLGVMLCVWCWIRDRIFR